MLDLLASCFLAQSCSREIIDAVVQSDAKNVELWVDMLDRYVYYYQVRPLLLCLITACSIRFCNSDGDSSPGMTQPLN